MRFSKVTVAGGAVVVVVLLVVVVVAPVVVVVLLMVVVLAPVVLVVVTVVVVVVVPPVVYSMCRSGAPDVLPSRDSATRLAVPLISVMIRTSGLLPLQPAPLTISWITAARLGDV
jgi:hypothetical protein